MDVAQTNLILRCKVIDGSMLGLREQVLNSGVMIGQQYEATERGGSQGVSSVH